MPEWGMTYFGILKAGATAIPIDPASSIDEIVNFASKGEAAAIVLSPKLASENSNLVDRLAESGIDIKIWTFDEVFEMPSEIEEANRLALLPQKVLGNAVASLIFTSGTTGTPKAVMLSHKNFTNMVSMLSSVLDMDTSDGVLSVLPMHHTFEFSAGFLTPLSNGTQITYLDELSSEELSHAIENGHVTGMVGVPALRCSIAGSKHACVRTAIGSPISPTMLSNSMRGYVTTRRLTSARSSFSRSIRAWAAICVISSRAVRL
jgi:long-chain acyl-CoA synthetase